MLKGMAVRKTATTKKKKTERDGKGKKYALPGDFPPDALWRPLGAAFEVKTQTGVLTEVLTERGPEANGVNEMNGTNGANGANGANGTNRRQETGNENDNDNESFLLEPPRVSEEVQPVNLNELFEGEEVNACSKVQVVVRIRPDGGGSGSGTGDIERASADPGASPLGQALGMGAGIGMGMGMGMGTMHARGCLSVASGGRLGVVAPLGSLAYKNGECKNGHVMAFNRVFGPETSQMEYYAQTGKGLVEQLVHRERFEGVLLSYGMTAAGKTYTIQGTKERPGIIPLALQTLFGKLKREEVGTEREGGGRWKVEISYCEIYNESIYDLLDTSKQKRQALKLMEAKDGSIVVDKLSWVAVGQAQEAWCVLRGGMKQRKRAATKLNYSSSRSHSVCGIRLTDLTSGKSRKLSFVDLAGSERAHRTEIAGSTANRVARMKEAVRCFRLGWIGAD